MMKKILTISALLAYSCIASAAEVEPIKMVYEPFKFPTSVKKKEDKEKLSRLNILKNSLDCNMEVSPLIDERQNKVTLGSKWVKPLLPNGLDTWFVDAFKDLERAGIKAGDSGKPTVRMQPYLTRLYANSRGMNLHGIMALRLEYYQGDKKLDVARVRGYSTAANWANGDGEYVDVLNRAVHEVLPEIKASAAKVCQNL